MCVLASVVCGILHWGLGRRDSLLMGSSGILFAFIGLHCCSAFRSIDSDGKGYPIRLPLTFLITVTIYVGEEVFRGFTSKDDGVSRLTHVTGAAVGIAYAVCVQRSQGKLKAN